MKKAGDQVAERQGFEPWIEFPLYTLSKRAPSATRPSLRGVGCSYLNKPAFLEPDILHFFFYIKAKSLADSTL